MPNAVIGALRVNLGIDSAEFQDGLADSQASLAKWAKAAAVAAAAAGAAIAGALAAGVKQSLDEADELSKVAQKIGVPIEELSKLRYAADLSGVSIESLTTATGKLAQNMVKALAGGKAAGAFDALGISVKNADGSMKTTSAVMSEISDRFAALADGPSKTAAAMALFGKTGSDLIPLLNGGSLAIRAMTDEAKALGLEISSKTGAAAETFNDNLSRIGYAVSGVTLALTAALAPALAAMSDVLVEVAKASLSLVEYLPVLAENAAVAGGALAVMFAPTIIAAVNSLAVAIGTQLVGAIRLLTTAIAANPLGFLAVAIAGIVVVIYNFRDEIQRAIGVDVVGIVKTAANLIIGSFRAAFEDIKFVWVQFPNIIGAAVIGAVNAVVEGVGKMINAVSEKINQFTQGISGYTAYIGLEIAAIPAVNLQGIENKYAEQLGSALTAHNANVKSILSTDYLGQLGSAFSAAKPAADGLGQSVNQLNSELDLNELSGGKAAKGATEAKDAWEGLRTVSDGVREKMQALQQQTRDINGAWTEFGRGGRDILEGLADGTLTWKDALKDALDMAIDLFTNLANANNPAGFGGGIFGSILNGLTGLGGGTGFGTSYFPPAPSFGGLGFASGGTILPGGTGGIDSQLVQFRKSPNERVDITKPGQQLTSGDGVKEIKLTVIGEEGPMFRPTIRAESEQVSVNVVRQNNEARRNYKENGGEEW